MDNKPMCFKCGKTPGEIDEYRYNMDDEPDPNKYVRENEGTYNKSNGHFCCTSCYIKIGMPTLPFPDRWVAP